MAKILLFLAEGFEEIEGLTVVDLLRRAGMDIEMISITDSLFVTGSHHITVTADNLFTEADFTSADMLVLPGGMPGTRNLQAHEGLREQLLAFHSAGKMLAAICAAPLVLGCNGILQGKTACCFPSFEEELCGAKVVFENVVCDNNIITSRGLGTAIEFACAIITHFLGSQKATQMKEAILYPHMLSE